MNGACKRWAVLHKHDKSPIEGSIYIHKSKAMQRMAGLARPEKHCVEMVCIVPDDVMMRLLAAIPNGTE